MTEPLRIYVSGPAGSGKTEVARLLQVQHGFTRVSLGDLCRAEARRRGWPEDRAHLQAAGDRLRGADPAQLAALALAQVRCCTGPVVIEGVRLQAEARYLREHGCIGVAVEAPEALRAARLRARDGSSRVPEHTTEREAGALPVDLRLTNGGDRESLERQVRLMVARAALLQAERVSRVHQARPARATGRRREPAAIER